MSERSQEWIVSVGNPFDGLVVYGPFKNHTDALSWAEDCGGDWYIIPLENPE